MVTWQVFVELAFDVAEQKGAQFGNIDDGGAFLSDLAMVWQKDKEQYRQMTREQAIDVLDDLVEA